MKKLQQNFNSKHENLFFFNTVSINSGFRKLVELFMGNRCYCVGFLSPCQLCENFFWIYLEMQLKAQSHLNLNWQYLNENNGRVSRKTSFWLMNQQVNTTEFNLVFFTFELFLSLAMIFLFLFNCFQTNTKDHQRQNLSIRFCNATFYIRLGAIGQIWFSIGQIW